MAQRAHDKGYSRDIVQVYVALDEQRAHIGVLQEQWRGLHGLEKQAFHEEKLLPRVQEWSAGLEVADKLVMAAGPWPRLATWVENFLSGGGNDSNVSTCRDQASAPLLGGDGKKIR